MLLTSAKVCRFFGCGWACDVTSPWPTERESDHPWDSQLKRHITTTHQVEIEEIFKSNDIPQDERNVWDTYRELRG